MKKKRGFAVMDPKKQRQIASSGGRTAHEHGTAHTWNSTEARKAAMLGVEARRKKKAAAVGAA